MLKHQNVIHQLDDKWNTVMLDPFSIKVQLSEHN